MENDSGTGLPASIEAAWGVRERPTKGPKPGLSLERIIDAAVAIASAEGLAAVSMNRVAKELGAGPMSLYRYVTAKDELVSLMEDSAFGPPPEISAEKDWRAGLTEWAWTIRAAYRRHPWSLGIPISAPPITPNQVAWLELGLSCLRDTGLAEHEKMSTVLLLSGYVRNDSTVMVAVYRSFEKSGEASADEWMATYARRLAKLADRERFPALHAVLDAGVLERADDPDDEFIFGLERVLDGIEALMTRRSAS
jgi:AcrR family transcriptional regulator